MSAGLSYRVYSLPKTFPGNVSLVNLVGHGYSSQISSTCEFIIQGFFFPWFTSLLIRIKIMARLAEAKIILSSNYSSIKNKSIFLRQKKISGFTLECFICARHQQRILHKSSHLFPAAILLERYHYYPFLWMRNLEHKEIKLQRWSQNLCPSCLNLNPFNCSSTQTWM